MATPPPASFVTSSPSTTTTTTSVVHPQPVVPPSIDIENLRSNPNSNRMAMVHIACWICGELGHTSAECQADNPSARSRRQYLEAQYDHRLSLRTWRRFNPPPPYPAPLANRWIHAQQQMFQNRQSLSPPLNRSPPPPYSYRPPTAQAYPSSPNLPQHTVYCPFVIPFPPPQDSTPLQPSPQSAFTPVPSPLRQSYPPSS